MSYKKMLQEVIEKETKEKKRTPIYAVGQHTLDICGDDENMCEIVYCDLAQGGMKIADVEKKISAAARKNRMGNFGFVSPEAAEEIIKKHFGLQDTVTETEKHDGYIDLDDFLV